MRRTLIALVVCLPALVCSAARPPEGRWEGRVEIPGSELQLIVDLAQESAGGWTGSIIIPGLGIKGAALSNVVVTDTDVAFDIGKVLGTPTHGPAGFRAHLIAADSMDGRDAAGRQRRQTHAPQGGARASRIAPRSTPVRRELEDQWTGEYELGGYPRRVTIILENHAAAGASAKFVIVGKMTNDLPVDLVVQQGDLLRVESQSTQVYFEGRIFTEAGEIRGTIEVGPVELPLVLRRASRRTS
jgi:hypothetical protein